MLAVVGDRVQHVSVVLLPVVLLFDAIQQQYWREGAKKQYKNEFRCYFDLQLHSCELDTFQPGSTL